jgi:hypothetical protein
MAVKSADTCQKFALFQTSEKAIMELEIKFEQLYLERMIVLWSDVLTL